jgi:glyoxylase-like metal-dependent hydrolase (beta-lactamase superfamily II)
MDMQRLVLLAGLCAVALVAQPALAQTPDMSLTRLECGTPGAPTVVNQRFLGHLCLWRLEDPARLQLLSRQAWQRLPAVGCRPCHDRPQRGSQGEPGRPAGAAQLKPEQIKYVAISHYHGDHIGQVGSFPQVDAADRQGRLGRVDQPQAAEGANPAPFANWIKGESKVEAGAARQGCVRRRQRDHAVHAGHTPGHHSLLVKLPQMGPVILSGDLMHFRENYDTNGVPTINTDRAQTLASLDRAKKIVAGAKATVIIQHDARDLDKLPAFPAAAK